MQSNRNRKNLLDTVKQGNGGRELKVRLPRMDLKKHPLFKPIPKQKQSIKERKLKVRLLRMKKESKQQIHTQKTINSSKPHPKIPREVIFLTLISQLTYFNQRPKLDRSFLKPWTNLLIFMSKSYKKKMCLKTTRNQNILLECSHHWVKFGIC